MLKNIFIILSIITPSMYTYTMEVEIEKNITETSPGPCPFLMLPHDLQNLIASFLIFDDIESEQEFIERTKKIKIKPFSDKYSSLIYSPNFEKESLFLQIINGDCLDNNSFFPVIIKFANASHSLIIIDKKKNQTIYEKKLDKDDCSKIAVSRNATMFATIHNEPDCSGLGSIEVMDYKTILSIKNITSQKTEFHTIPDSFSIPSALEYPAIAFNKQGTHIILHGNDYNQLTDDSIYAFNNPIQYHMIFPLTVNTPDQSTDNKKTLEKYFKQQMICKNFSK